MISAQDYLQGATFDFHMTTLDIFRYQAENNQVYKKWLHYLGIHPMGIDSIDKIPFLPIELFRQFHIITGSQKPEILFKSSGTTEQKKSIHAVTDVELYKQSFSLGFRKFYGDPSTYRICCLLPSYQQSGDSSLVYMCQHLIEQSGHPDSGFYYQKENELLNILQIDSKTPTLLLGVSYALLDLAKHCHFPVMNTIIMETGGMKGRRTEMVREELHATLASGFGTTTIHSEYGMTELLSQAYSDGAGLFSCPPWMRVLVRDAEDPFGYVQDGKSGLLNIIDLANVNSCCFIATQDAGILYRDGRFKVTGRSDNSDLRGCNLLIQ